MLITPISIFPRRRGKRLRHTGPNRKELRAAEPRSKQQALLHRRDAMFTKIGVFLDQELFTRRPQRLRGEFSSGSTRSLVIKEAIGAIGRRAFSDYRIAFFRPCAARDLFGRETPPPYLPGAKDRRGDSLSRVQRHTQQSPGRLRLCPRSRRT